MSIVQVRPVVVRPTKANAILQDSLSSSFEHNLWALTETTMNDNQHEQDEEEFFHHRRDHMLDYAVVVSGESELDDDDDDDAEWVDPVAREIKAQEAALRFKPNNETDDLYDKNLDDEDEAYVYKNMRGGVQESVEETYSGDREQDPTAASGSSTHIQKVYKPRRSDAVLSCPSCFNIVCMDCQRHQRYLNQYRAMFVMGVTVNWHSRLVYDREQQMLVPKPHFPHHVQPDIHSASSESEEFPIQYRQGEYFPVHCASCHTQVAALDMPDEVYHFYGCLESSY